MADYSIKLTITGDGTVAVQAVDRVKAATGQMGKAGKDAGKQAEAGFKQAEQGAVRLNDRIRAATGFVLGFAGAFASIRMGQAFIRMADTWSDLTSRVKVSIGAHEDAAAVMDRLAKVARQTYSSMEFTADSFARNAVTLKALGKTTQEQLDYTAALNNALVVSGAKGQAFEQVQNALGKAMAVGTLRGLELNTVLDRGSAVAEALAEELEKDVLQLRRLGAEGKITGDVIFTALVKRMKELEATAETMPATVEDGMVILRNAFLQTIGFADQAAGSTNDIAEAIINLADIISRPDVKQGFADIAIGAVNAAAEVAKLFGQVKSLADFAGRLAASKITGWIDPDDIELSGKRFRELHAELVKLESGERSWLGVTKGMREERINLIKAEMATLQDSIKNATIWQENNRIAAEDAESAALSAAEAAEAQRQAQIAALRSLISGSDDASGAVLALAGELENLYNVQHRVTDVTGDVDAMIRDLAYSLASDATRALMDYEDVQLRILDLEMQWLELGPMSEMQIAKLAELRALSAKAHERNLQDLSGVNARELMHMARGWDNFASDMAGAILDGSKGVKRWWKAMIDDMKHQLLRSGLLNLLKGLFPGAGGLQMAGGGAGVGFGQIIGSMFGGGAGGMGGSVLSGISTAISGGITAGLTGLGGLIGGGLGTGLVSAGMHIGSAGVFGGMASSFGAGMASMGSGSLMMGLGQMLPMIGAVLAAAAAIDKISGGKLFGTKYKFDSASRDIDFGPGGVGGQDSLTQVRQRSLFRGRKWQTTATDLDAEVRGPLEEFWNAVLDSNSQIAARFGRDAAIDVPASFRQEFDKDGNVTKEIGTILGRTFAEDWEQFGKRAMAENMIANIDGSAGGIFAAIGVPAPGVGGGGGGVGRRPGDADEFVQGIVGISGAIADATQPLGEASAIAERWRHDADLLLEGAQFLLLAAGDLYDGFGLLGDGTLTQVADLITDMQGPGETLSDTYRRVAGSAALLDAALEISGVQIDGTREFIVRLAADIAEAAGGLDRAGALWSNYFERFYSDTERAQLALTQAQKAADVAFGAIGLDVTAFTGEGGMEAFREMFEQAMPTLSAEAIVKWLEAAAALGIVIDAQDAYNGTLGEAAEVISVTAEMIANRLAILGDIASAIEDFGLSDWELQLKSIAKQTQHYVDALVETGMSLEDATAAAQAYGDAATAAAQAQRAAQQVGILTDIAGAVEDFGLSEWERQLKAIAQQTQSYIDALVETGMALEDATTASQVYSEAATEAAEAAREAARLADIADIFQRLADDLAGMDLALAEFGMSDFAKTQARILRETTDAVAEAQLLGASAAEILAIELIGVQRAAAAAAMAAAEFTSSLADWEFEDYLAGLSDVDAAMARANQTWEARYLQAVEIFGEGSEEAIRVMGLWDNEIGRITSNVVDAVAAIVRASADMGAIIGTVRTWAEELQASLAHVTSVDGMGQWLSDLSGLPRRMSQGIKRPMAEVVALVEQEYLQQAANLQQQIDAAYSRLAALPWDAQAQQHILEGQIAALQAALGSVTGGMGMALEELKAMYIASLSGVRDYLDSMLLGDLSALTPADRLAEAWDQLTAAAEGGDAAGATRLADVYLRLLREYVASGDDYNQGFWGVRDLLEGMFDTDWMDGLAGLDGDAQLAAADIANDLLERIAQNTAAANGASGIPSYAVGTYNVPATGPAILHAGEMVLPRPMADAMRRGAIGGDNQALEAKLDGVIQRLDKLDRTTATGAQKVSDTVVKTGADSDRNADASRARHAQAQRRGVTA